MQLESRPATAHTVHAVLDLLCRAFELDRATAEPIFFADPLFDLSHKWLLFANGQPVSTATVVPLEMNMGGWTMPCAGIAGVATDPTQQGRGFASTLLRDLLRALPPMGYLCAVLVPNRRQFYERLGFVMVGERYRAELLRPSHHSSHPTRWATWEDAPVLSRLYDLHGAHRLGALRRDERRWQYVLWHNPRIAIFGDPPHGYAVLAQAFDSMTVKELMPPLPGPGVDGSLTSDAIALAGRLEDIRGWVAAGYRVRQSPQREDHFMARIVDVHEVIRRVATQRPRHSGSLAVHDPVIGANAIAVHVDEGRVAQTGSANHSTSIEELTRALFLGAERDPLRSLGLFPHRGTFTLYPCDYF